MDEITLIDRCLLGDEKAWKTLVQRFSTPIYSLCYNFTRNVHEAEDLTQEVFVKLFTNLDRYSPKYSFLTWAMKVARNLCIDAYRKCRHDPSAFNVGEGILTTLPSSEDPGASAESREKVALALSALHEQEEEMASMILMRDLMGFSYDELSTIYEIPVGTVKSRLNRGRFAVAMAIHRKIDGTAREAQA